MSWRVYLGYLKAMGMGKVSLVFAVIVLGCGAPLFNSIWLSLWTGDPVFANSTGSSDEVKQGKMQMYLTVFSCNGVVGG